MPSSFSQFPIALIILGAAALHTGAASADERPKRPEPAPPQITHDDLLAATRTEHRVSDRTIAAEDIAECIQGSKGESFILYECVVTGPLKLTGHLPDHTEFLKCWFDDDLVLDHAQCGWGLDLSHSSGKWLSLRNSE